MRGKMHFRCGWYFRIICLAVVLNTFMPTWAQEVTANIVGTVMSSSANSIPIAGAAVSARDVNRGTVVTAQTNEVGDFNISHIPVGTYEVSVEAKDFQKAVLGPMTLDLNQTARLNFKLQIGNVNETVTVTSKPPALQTETTEVGTLINAATNDNLPLATRNPVQLTLLSPGAITVDTKSLNLGSNTAEGGGRPYINGNREESNNFLLDGIDNNQISENRLALTPSPDAIQEFNLITQNASSEFGNYDGGIVNMTLKSGTNNFHGDVFEFFRNDIFNANQWENGLDPSHPIGTPKLRWNMFGGTIGGPILKDKLFFFADYQGGRLDHPASGSVVDTLTPAEASGNFSALLTQGVQLYNPCAAGTGIPGTPCQILAPSGRTAFTGNIIPSNMLDPVFTSLVNTNFYAQGSPNTSTGLGTVVNTTSQKYNTDQGDVKIDYNVTDRDRIFGRYSQAYQVDPSTNSLLLLGNTTNIAHLYNTAFNWTHAFNSSLINEARLGTNYVFFSDGDTTFDPTVGNLATTIGMANGNPGSNPGLPLLGFGGGSITNVGTGLLTNLGSAIILKRFATTVIQFDDGLVWTRGRHILKFGYQMNRYRINVFYSGNAGELGMLLYDGNYSATSTANPNPSSSQLNLAAAADFALGLPNLVGRGASTGGWHQEDWLFAGYAQDDWHIKDNLTLNLGLRYEARTPWVDVNNRQVNVNINTGGLQYVGNTPVQGVGGNGFSSGLYNSTYGLPDFEPRVGLAWTPGFDKKLVVRAAYSISSYLEGTGTNLRLTQNPPFTPSQTQDTNVAMGTPFFTAAGAGAGSVSGQPFRNATMLAWAGTVQPAMAQQWNLTLERSLSNDLSLQVGYVGQHGTHLMVPLWLTQGDRLPNGTINYPFIGGQNGNGTFGPNDFGAVKDTASIGRMSYNALQVVLNKRLSHGLEAKVSYTFSKCMTNNSGYFGTWSNTTQATPASPYFQNLYDPGAEWSQCYYDTKHMLSAYAVYDLPFGHGRQFGGNAPKPIDTAFGDWSVNPIVSWHSGFPIALYGTEASGTFSGANDAGSGRPNCNDALLTYPKTSSSAGMLWFNPAFETTPAPGTFGNCPPQGPVIGPGYADVDMSLQKNFPINESMKFQFRSDFLNLFNHPQFAHPNPGSGLITASQDAREIQFALKFYF